MGGSFRKRWTLEEGKRGEAERREVREEEEERKENERARRCSLEEVCEGFGLWYGTVEREEGVFLGEKSTGRQAFGGGAGGIVRRASGHLAVEGRCRGGQVCGRIEDRVMSLLVECQKSLGDLRREKREREREKRNQKRISISPKTTPSLQTNLLLF